MNRNFHFYSEGEMTETTPVGLLSKEQQIAFTQFLKMIEDVEYYYVYAEKAASCHGAILPTDFIAASPKPFPKSHIPREGHWIWNQSNSKVSVRLNANSIVTLRKINPRKRSGANHAPSYKVWLYHVQDVCKPDTHVIWCEKGIESGIKTPIGLIFPDQLCIKDFAFLHPYVDTKLAHEFGWI